MNAFPHIEQALKVSKQAILTNLNCKLEEIKPLVEASFQAVCDHNNLKRSKYIKEVEKECATYVDNCKDIEVMVKAMSRLSKDSLSGRTCPVRKMSKVISNVRLRGAQFLKGVLTVDVYTHLPCFSSDDLDNDEYYNKITITLEIPLNPVMLEYLLKEKELCKIRDDLHTQERKVQHAIANIDTHMQELEARLLQEELKSTAEGRKALELSNGIVNAVTQRDNFLLK